MSEEKEDKIKSGYQRIFDDAYIGFRSAFNNNFTDSRAEPTESSDPEPASMQTNTEPTESANKFESLGLAYMSSTPRYFYKAGHQKDEIDVHEEERDALDDPYSNPPKKERRSSVPRRSSKGLYTQPFIYTSEDRVSKDLNERQSAEEWDFFRGIRIMKEE